MVGRVVGAVELSPPVPYPSLVGDGESACGESVGFVQEFLGEAAMTTRYIGNADDIFTCEVDVRHDGRYFEVWVSISNDYMMWCFEEFLIGFDTEADANRVAEIIRQAMRDTK
jgi:hypothetical protein